jgi:hypothetical protein
MFLFESGLSELDLDGCKFPLQNANDEIPASAGWFQEPRVDSVCLVFDKIEHGIDQPWRGEHLSMVGNSLL